MTALAAVPTPVPAAGTIALPADDPHLEPRPCTNPARVLTACVLASSMAFIDGSALTVALPALKAAFAADFAGLQWVLNGYTLALAALTLTGGALADRYGHARMLIFGCTLFALASVACALAPNLPTLIAARIVQGTGAALLTPASLSLISTVFPAGERSRAIGIWAAASALTTAGGPVLGGWLTDVVGWQAIFWINPPLAIIASALLVCEIGRGHRSDGTAFDLPGALLAAVALAGLAYLLGTMGPGESGAPGTRAEAPIGGNGFGWITGAVSCLALGGFLVRQHCAAAPMMPLTLFANRSFGGLNMATVLLYGAQAALIFAVPFELIATRGLDATAAGLVLLPFTLGVGLLSRPFGWLADRYGPRPLLLAGSAGLCCALTAFAVAAGERLWLAIIAPMTIVGISFAVLVAPLTAAVMGCVSGQREGLASGINNTAARIAQLIGFATAAGLASYDSGFLLTMGLGSVLAALAFLTIAVTVPMTKPAPANET